MSLLSRNTGGRRTVRLAAVFAGTLLMYLVVTAVPAFAASTCSNVTDPAILAVNVGTDDTVVLKDTGPFTFSQNGGAFVACAGTAVNTDVSWIQVVGSNAGNETFVLLEPGFVDSVSHENVTVDLGNGTDTLNLDWGDAPGLTGSDPFPSVPSSTSIGTAAGGVQVADTFAGASTGFLRIDNAENLIVTGDSLLTPPTADLLDDGNADGILASAGTASAADDIPAAVAGSPATANLTFAAGAGDDSLISGDGNENFQGGPGSDDVSYEAASGDVVVDLTAGTGTGMGTDTLSDVQDATGGDFNDTITGNTLNNVLNGGDGDDTLAGLTGDDTVNGDAGDDVINEDAAANGADILNGGSGGPEVVGDTLNYGARTTDITIKAGGGAVSGASGEKDTVGTDFENYVTGSGNDTLVGGAGNESFNPGSGTNTVDGDGGGADFLDLSSQTGPATIDLSANAGTATAGTTSDAFKNVEGIVGTSANDTLNWDGTGTLLDFAAGDGVDIVDASTSTGGVNINLALFGNGHEVENATGGSGDDVLAGNVLGNVLLGNDGVDIIDGYGGNDFIEGGLGNDSLDTDFGNTGADTLSYKHAASGEDIDNQLGFATGGDGQDSIGFFAIILGSDFNDTIVAGQNSFGLNQRINGRKGNDNITGSNSSDVLKGQGGNDTIRGGGGDDTIKGAAGNDNLFGSSGDDFLSGGKGSDHGNGGSGADTCKGVEFRKSC